MLGFAVIDCLRFWQFSQTANIHSDVESSCSVPQRWIRRGDRRFGCGDEQYRVVNRADDRAHWAFAIYNASANNNYLNGSVGIGTTAPGQKLEVNGKVKIDSFGSATASTVCQLSGVLSSCSSSIRYKENVKDADFGLRQVQQLRPVTFKWRGRDENDFGFIAEEVAKIDPLFATYKDGHIEGVTYPQLTAILAKAIQEQQAEIDRLIAVNGKQSAELDGLLLQVIALRDKTKTRTALK